MNSEYPKQLPEKIESKKEFEIDYEPFDPKVELKKLRKGDKETGAEKLEEYKKDLIKQKEGIVEIQLDLEKQIRENPELDQNELMKTVLLKAPEYKLSENQLVLFKETLNKYIEKHQAVREARKKYPDDKELFKACFGKEPEGMIEVIERPINLHFRCHNIKDFAWLFQKKILKPLEEQELKESDLKTAEKIGGHTISECLLTPLQDVITAEKAKYESSLSSRAKEILGHEEQHIICRLFQEIRFRNYIKAFLSNKEIRDEIVKELQDKKPPTSLIDCLRPQRKIFESKAKDEILAFYKTKKWPLEKILEKLTRKEGAYDYFDKRKEIFEKTIEEKLGLDVYEKNEETINKALEQVFVNEYQQELTKAINAIGELEKIGKSRNEIIYLLITEPLDKWEKLVNRIKQAKKYHGASS